MRDRSHTRTNLAAGVFILLALASGNVSAQDPPSPEGLAIHALPDRIVERNEDVVRAEYVRGMPICIEVRIVNAGVKKMRAGATAIPLRTGWYDDVTLNVSGTDQKRLPADGLAVLAMRDTGNPADKVLADPVLADNEVRWTWVLDSESVRNWPPGEHEIVIGFGAVRAKRIIIELIDADPADPGVAVRIRQARAAMLRGDYTTATSIAEEVMTEAGRDARDDNEFAILIAAESYDKTDRLDRALAAYREFQEIFAALGYRGVPQKVNWHVADLQRRIAVGSEER